MTRDGRGATPARVTRATRSPRAYFRSPKKTQKIRPDGSRNMIGVALPYQITKYGDV